MKQTVQFLKMLVVVVVVVAVVSSSTGVGGSKKATGYGPVEETPYEFILGPKKAIA